MRIRILCITLVLCAWQFADAQQSEPFYKTSKERFAWFLNPGVSIGFGGYRAFNAVPMIALKSGPFHISGMYIPGSRTELACYGVGLDIFQFSDSKGRSNAIGLTAGYSSLQRDPEFYRAYQSHDLLLS